ncbi:TonB family protein [Carboxylicivirga sp. N1Y90]|uniref:TonB family protein n=1 Tax=Carboxylicivirga fragile TaxID=3417571 RepID=UPI003D3250E6|nr:TonB family protein [Marinilabiliaceae bacterium N1Y90]
MNDKNKKYGVIGTTVFHLLLLLLLIFFGLKTLPQEEEGILVNFGDTILAGGEVEPKQAEPEKVEEVTPPPPAKEPEPVIPEPEEETIKAQDYDDAPVVQTEAEKKKEREEWERLDKLRKEQEEADRIRKEKLEADRKAEAERKRIEEEKRIEQERLDKQAADIRNKTKGAFGKSTGDSDSEGEDTGSGNQGYTSGDPNSKNRKGSGLGNSGSGFDLTGRSLVGGLPKPSYNIQEEGIINVKIRVDRNGNVTSAEFQLKGSTTQNNYLKQKAIEAAKKAKFNADKMAAAYQEGTITYHFVLD